MDDDDESVHAIERCAAACRTWFDSILEAVLKNKDVAERTPILFHQLDDDSPIMTLTDLRDDYEQYRVWCRNIGVFAADQGSLDYRLRNADDIKQSICRLLRQMRKTLGEGDAQSMWYG